MVLNIIIGYWTWRTITYWALRLLGLGLILWWFSRVARLDPKGAGHARRSANRDIAIALGAFVLWMAPFVLIPIALIHWLHFPVDRTLDIAAGACFTSLGIIHPQVFTMGDSNTTRQRMAWIFSFVFGLICFGAAVANYPLFAPK